MDKIEADKSVPGIGDPQFNPEKGPKQDPWAHRSKGMKCVTCMWFVQKQPAGRPGMPPSDKRIILGRCRRHAPTMNGYPVVFEADWCGDNKLDENKI